MVDHIGQISHCLMTFVEKRSKRIGRGRVGGINGVNSSLPTMSSNRTSALRSMDSGFAGRDLTLKVLQQPSRYLLLPIWPSQPPYRSSC